MPDLKEIISAARRKGLSNNEIQRALLKKGYSQQEISDALSTKAKQYTQVPLPEKIKLLFNPTEFFKKVREPTIGTSLIMLIIVTVFALVVQYTFYFVLLRGLGGAGLSFLSGAVFGYLGFFGLIFSFLTALIIHGVAKLFKGVGTYTDSYNAVAYGTIPAMVFSIIPYVGLLAWIYAIVFEVFGISEYYNISKGKAVVAVLTPIAVFFILMAAFAIFLIFTFRGFGF